MKLQRTSKLFGLLLLIGALSGACEARGTPQHQFGERGVVQTVDFNNNSLTVLNRKNVTQTFAWNSGTWFRQKTPKPCASWLARLFYLGEKTNAAALQPGRTVLIYGHREYGRSVAREIVVLLPVSTCSCKSADEKHGGILSPAE